MSLQDQFRQLPSVDELASSAGGGFSHELAVEEARLVLDLLRTEIRNHGTLMSDPATLLRAQLESLRQPSLQPVRNATGVILHTNLGRAPLPELPAQAWYSNLEYDLQTGKRGQRDTHTLGLLRKLLGAPAVLVNNGAAAVYLALHELAAGCEVIVSRGELIEIGDGFRIPDIMARSGASLVEVGATNKTRIEDYRRAITDRTRLLMRVHPSNFRMEGFTGRPSLEELTALGRETGVPVYEDLGSGCLLDLREYGVREPTIGQSLQAGVDLVSFSGDKLLGGPQAGILAGREDLVHRIRRNPMFRALRLDKLVIAAMEATLRHMVLREYDQIPVLRMLRISLDELKGRAEAIATHFEGADVIAGESLLGGGSTPQQALPTWLVSLPPEWDSKLRAQSPPLIGRMENGRLLLDPRTLCVGDPLLVRAL
ncbi:MAG: L-seryl-tRNA(Sec) selenium transferase [Bryobacterales bacterium]|nr:L-seryl-tRNA(Sec) selenium transferase [Bryobacterales bacterium]